MGAAGDSPGPTNHHKQFRGMLQTSHPVYCKDGAGRGGGSCWVGSRGEGIQQLIEEGDYS